MKFNPIYDENSQTKNSSELYNVIKNIIKFINNFGKIDLHDLEVFSIHNVVYFSTC